MFHNFKRALAWTSLLPHALESLNSLVPVIEGQFPVLRIGGSACGAGRVYIVFASG
jgi:hypothetical protein